MRDGITLEISPGQVENLIERLPLESKMRLMRRLQKETWANKMDIILGRMRVCAKNAKVSLKDINHICEEVKREYDEKHRSS